jgi:LacI family transcriptional regulator
MSGTRVTLKEIAKQVGLSVATISRALSDHPDISTETKDRVRSVAQSLGYIPNYRARYLREKQSRLIALIVPEMDMFFYPWVITGINRVVQQADYSLIVFQSDNSVEQERRLVEYCTQLSADGVLLVLSTETADLEHLEVLHDCGIPVALLDRTIDTTRYTTITIDDESAGHEATSYLLDRGHTQVVGIFHDERQRTTASRVKGFRRAHRERDLPLAESQILRVDDISRIAAMVDGAFRDHPRLSAVFTMTDELLVHTHHLLTRRRLRIPEDVSLISISDGRAPAFLHPNVTHVRHSGVEEGERSAHILIGMIEHGSDSMLDVRIRTTLVERGSVATRAVSAERQKAVKL